MSGLPSIYALRKRLSEVTGDPFRSLRRRRQEASLREEYHSLDVSREADIYGLYRIIGNDLPPRHHLDQSLQNLRFILENEPPLERCGKLWIINRIHDPAREAAIRRLLKQFDQPYEHIPFIVGEYQQIGLDHTCLPDPDYLESAACRRLTEDQRIRLTLALNRLKINYIMNVNGARNLALSLVKQDSQWVLPHDSAEQFDTALPYGRREKLELFWRLGAPGPPQDLRNDPWDLRRSRISPDEGTFSAAGWICRLASGYRISSNTRISTSKRFRQRQVAILAMIEQADAGLARN